MFDVWFLFVMSIRIFGGFNTIECGCVSVFVDTKTFIFFLFSQLKPAELLRVETNAQIMQGGRSTYKICLLVYLVAIRPTFK